VRFGDKEREAEQVPLDMYVRAYYEIQRTLEKKYAQWEEMKPVLNSSNSITLPSRHSAEISIFLSTETQSVVKDLPEAFTAFLSQHHHLHFPSSPPKIFVLNYHRIEKNPPHMVARYDLVPSLANLYIALHADGFIGTFSSNWCRLLWDLEMASPEGGRPYMSVDVEDDFLY
jgi:hypothetical protein